MTHPPRVLYIGLVLLAQQAAALPDDFPNYHRLPMIDNGVHCTDQDGDDYYGQAACPGALDTDDERWEVNPGMDELCGDLIDNNSDGVVDEAGCVGTTYYVDFSADDGGDGSEDAPWRLLTTARDAVQAGDTIILVAGDHKPGFVDPEPDATTTAVDWNRDTSGTPTRPIAIRGRATRNVATTLDCSTYFLCIALSADYVIFENISILGGNGAVFRYDGGAAGSPPTVGGTARHLELKPGNVNGVTTNPILLLTLAGGDGFVFERNLLQGDVNAGKSAADIQSSNAVFRYNEVKNVARVNNPLVFAKGGATNVWLYNNFIHSNADVGAQSVLMTLGGSKALYDKVPDEYAYEGVRLRAFNNVLESSPGGIALRFQDCLDCVAYHNTIHAVQTGTGKSAVATSVIGNYRNWINGYVYTGEPFQETTLYQDVDPDCVGRFVSRLCRHPSLNAQFRNNIIRGVDTRSGILISSDDDDNEKSTVASHNLWDLQPALSIHGLYEIGFNNGVGSTVYASPSSAAQSSGQLLGVGGVEGAPQFFRAFDPRNPQIKAFALTATSPARGVALTCGPTLADCDPSDPALLVSPGFDYFWNIRDAAPDAGAFEYVD